MKSFAEKSSIAIVAVGLAIGLLTVSALPIYGFANEPRPLRSIRSNTPRLVTSKFSSDESVQVDSGLPIRLRIPSIEVDSAIEYVGLTDRGEMGVPKGHRNVAWFSLGPRPGEFGSAVIAGHYSWKGNGAGGVFRNLAKLRKGDMIYIVDDSGLTVSFIVRENRLVDFDSDPTEVFASYSGIHLNLITCAGTWDGSKQSSTKRRVVFAEIVQRRPAATTN